MKRRNDAVAQFFAGRRKSLASKAEWRAKRNVPSRLDVGHMLTGSWGYDQTNVEAWQVVELVGKNTVKIRRVATTTTRETGFAAEYVIPCPDEFVDHDIITKRVSEGHRVSMDHCSLTPWNGRPLYCSHYA